MCRSGSGGSAQSSLRAGVLQRPFPAQHYRDPSSTAPTHVGWEMLAPRSTGLLIEGPQLISAGAVTLAFGLVGTVNHWQVAAAYQLSLGCLRFPKSWDIPKLQLLIPIPLPRSGQALTGRSPAPLCSFPVPL